MERTLKQMATAAKDMNKIMGLQPPIDTDQEMDELVENIKEEADEVLAKDRLAGTTWEILEELGVADEALAERSMTKPAKKPAKKKPAEKKTAKKKTEPKKPAKKKTVKKTTKSSAPKKSKPAEKTTTKKVGVISTIIDLLAKPLTKEDLLKKLAAKFPEREETALASTIRTQVPTRMNKERDFEIVKDDKNRFVIVND